MGNSNKKRGFSRYFRYNSSNKTKKPVVENINELDERLNNILFKSQNQPKCNKNYNNIDNDDISSDELDDDEYFERQRENFFIDNADKMNTLNKIDMKTTVRKNNL